MSLRWSFLFIAIWCVVVENEMIFADLQFDEKGNVLEVKIKGKNENAKKFSTIQAVQTTPKAERVKEKLPADTEGKR